MLLQTLEKQKTLSMFPSTYQVGVMMILMMVERKLVGKERQILILMKEILVRLSTKVELRHNR